MLRDVNGNQRFEENEVFVYTKDHLGSIKDITDLNAELKQCDGYSAYGVTKLEKDDTHSSNQFVENLYAYTSREWEQETGCYYYRARWYCPGMEKFISSDPISFSGGDINLYNYVLMNPLKYTDPNGKTPCSGSMAGFVACVASALAIVEAGSKCIQNYKKKQCEKAREQSKLDCKNVKSTTQSVACRESSEAAMKACEGVN